MRAVRRLRSTAHDLAQCMLGIQVGVGRMQKMLGESGWQQLLDNERAKAQKGGAMITKGELLSAVKLLCAVLAVLVGLYFPMITKGELVSAAKLLCVFLIMGGPPVLLCLYLLKKGRKQP